MASNEKCIKFLIYDFLNLFIFNPWSHVSFFLAILPAQEWKPPLPAYNFLRMMDAAASSHHPARKDPECMKETVVQENDKEQHEDRSANRKEPTETLRIKRWNRSNVFKAEKSFRHDNKELWCLKVSHFHRAIESFPKSFWLNRLKNLFH